MEERDNDKKLKALIISYHVLTVLGNIASILGYIMYTH